MQEKRLFEYAIIRVVPKVEREEFLNVGVIVCCQSLGFLKTEYELNKSRLLALSADLDLEELENRLLAFQKICEGKKEGGPIGKLPLAARFRWLTACRSTIVQTSPVHQGLCTDGQKIVDRLMTQMVK